ncbi:MULTISPECIES: hypothetical protein [unclassified Saccharicrinis]|uniref:hypothetical protein n=1 Tax=unclassified Saccharicrinis TaxID=2646859 RepID=UPI003D345FC0
MKQILTILVFTVLFTPKLLFSQDAPKKANGIIVKTDKSHLDLYKSTLPFLVDEGYEFQLLEKDAGIIQTKPHSINGGQIKLMCSIRQKDSTTIIKITGLCTIGTISLGGISDDSWSKVTNRGMKGSLFKNAWIHMESIAKKIDGTIEYQIK